MIRDFIPGFSFLLILLLKNEAACCEEYRITILFKSEFKYFFCFQQLRLKEISIIMIWKRLLYNDKNKNINNSFTNTLKGCIMEFKMLSSWHFVFVLFT